MRIVTAWALALAMAAGVAAGCAEGGPGATAVRVLTHRSFHLPTDALRTFTEETGIEVVVFREDTPDDVIDLLERSRTHPVADVVVGVDTLDLQYMIDRGLTQPYVPLAPGEMIEGLGLADHALTPISYLDACLNYMPSFYDAPQEVIVELGELPYSPPPLPRGLGALWDPAHSGTAVIPDAATSRIGVYLLLVLERLHPEHGDSDAEPWPTILDQMLRLGVELAPTWSAATFERFAGGEPLETEPFFTTEEPPPVTLESLEGRLPLAWGTAGLPSIYARFQPGLPDALDIAVLTDDCVRIVYYAGVVAGAQRASLGGRLIDAMGEPLFQFGISDTLGSRPARNDIVSTPEWRAFGVRVPQPYRPDPAYVGARWREWQATWNQVVQNFLTAPPLPEPEVTVTLPPE